ncbi:hypothetical protein BCR34DRAFT_599054 [Clohesyomyces aquaticus]|uniref:FAS1 domain-containing protein n=1 Tax=Clohesyomyces aquaticus TaxID=1231657 RepID=A0A1Y1ZW52_9PLEO|nr:hypothetical protein BCR34DRAFT_599054 [Clohesyomyces aquaticus]
MRFSTILFPLLGLLSIPALARRPPTNQTTPPYPNKLRIAQIFAPLTQSSLSGFLVHVAPDVDWALMGTHLLAEQYYNRTIFAIDALAQLANVLDRSHLISMTLTNIVGGGDEE